MVFEEVALRAVVQEGGERDAIEELVRHDDQALGLRLFAYCDSVVAGGAFARHTKTLYCLY